MGDFQGLCKIYQRVIRIYDGIRSGYVKIAIENIEMVDFPIHSMVNLSIVM